MIYSFIFHAVVLGYVLVMPIYGEEDGRVKSYLVYLPDSETASLDEREKPAMTKGKADSKPSSGRKSSADDMTDASGEIESRKEARTPKTPDMDALKKPAHKKEVGDASSKEAAEKTADVKKPDVRENNRKMEPKAAEKKLPERRRELVREVIEKSPARMVRRVENPVEKKAERIGEPVDKIEEPIDKEESFSEKEEPVERIEKSSKDVDETLKERMPQDSTPGWQESSNKVEIEKKETKSADKPEPAEEAVKDANKDEMAEKEPQVEIQYSQPPSEPKSQDEEKTILSKENENPAEKLLNEHETAGPGGFVDTNAPEQFSSPRELCRDCDLVSKLYKNPLVDIEEELEAEPHISEKEEPPADLSNDICEDCDVVSSVYENPAGDILNSGAGQETPSGVPIVESNGGGSASKIDLLCAGCFMVAMLDENPAEGIIYDYGPQGEVRAVGGFLSVIDEFCSECLKPLESAGDVEYRIWDPSAVKKIESVEVLTPSTVKAPGAIVIEVPDIELAKITRDTGVAVEEIEVDVPGEPEESPVVEIFTPAENRTPSVNDYLAGLDKDLKKLEKPEPSQDRRGNPVIPLFSTRDIEIKVFFAGDGASFAIMRKPHPMTGGSGRATDISDEVEEMITTEGSGLRRIFSLLKAEKGVYMFIINNGSAEVLDIDVNFLLHGGRGPERAKGYKDIKLAKGTRLEIKFLMPEAIFWDDDDYFTGEIEGPKTVTKFNDETGLIWKERSDGY